MTGKPFDWKNDFTVPQTYRVGFLTAPAALLEGPPHQGGPSYLRQATQAYTTAPPYRAPTPAGGDTFTYITLYSVIHLIVILHRKVVLNLFRP